MNNIIKTKIVVYKIPYRRVRAWPSGCSALRPSARAGKGILETTKIEKIIRWNEMNDLNR